MYFKERKEGRKERMKGGRENRKVISSRDRDPE